VTVSVLVPWRPDGTDRDQAWAYVSRWWAQQHPSWQMVTGTCPDGPWRKAVAVADALTKADGDVLVVADADVVCDRVVEAVEAVAGGSPWAIPHREVRRLTRSASQAVYGGAPLEHRLGGLTQSAYVGYEGGGILVLPRETYQRVPLDPRFAGWGAEDEAWALALRTVVGEHWRGRADLWHLWHEPQQRLNRHVGSQPSHALLVRYQFAAKDGPDAISRLLNEFNPAPMEAT
jgi:hypothetical protein